MKKDLLIWKTQQECTKVNHAYQSDSLYDETGRCVGEGGMMSVVYHDLSMGFKTTSLASK